MKYTVLLPVKIACDYCVGAEYAKELFEKTKFHKNLTLSDIPVAQSSDKGTSVSCDGEIRITVRADSEELAFDKAEKKFRSISFTAPQGARIELLERERYRTLDQNKNKELSDIFM